jgi:hypothetical protein
VLAVVAAMVGASFRSAQAGVVPRLVESPAELTAANAVASNLETVAMFTGPALGAALVGLVDVEVVFWLNAASYVWSLLLVSAVRVPAAEPAHDAAADDAAADDAAAEREAADEPGFVREVTAGFAELRRDRDLGVVAVLAASQGVVWGALTVFLVMVSIDMLDAGAAGVGYLNSVMGVGTVVGGLLLLGRAERGRLGQDMALGVLGWAVPLVALALFPSPVTAVAALAVIGLSDPWVNLGLDTIPQRLAPDRILSRVFAAVESSLIGAMALGSIVAPVLVHWLGLRPSMGALGGLVTLYVVSILGRMRRLDARLSEPEHLAVVRSIEMLRPLPVPVQEALARQLQPASYPAGSTILAQGDRSDRFYVICSGEVEVTQDGRVLRVQSAGDFFGEIGLLRDVPRTATVTALADTEVLTLDRADFLAAVTRVQEAASAAEDVVAHRLAV